MRRRKIMQQMDTNSLKLGWHVYSLSHWESEPTFSRQKRSTRKRTRTEPRDLVVMSAVNQRRSGAVTTTCLLRLTALFSSGSLATACSNNLDCELLGTCVNGTCECHSGFHGPTCGQLKLGAVTTQSPTQPGIVWPRTTPPLYPAGSAHTTIGWSFAPAWDPMSQRYVAAIEVVCDKWGSDVWIAAVSSDRPDGNWTFDRRLGPAGTNSPHMRRLSNGTFMVIFVAMTSGIYPANATRPGDPPVCVGNVTQPASRSASTMKPVFRPCGPDEAPSIGHDCLCSRESHHCPDAFSNTYLATTTNWFDGPWRIAPVEITGPGWAPYNATLPSIGNSNPTTALLEDGRTLLAIRSHAGYVRTLVVREHRMYVPEQL